jgi:hypothetical protein
MILTFTISYLISISYYIGSMFTYYIIDHLFQLKLLHIHCLLICTSIFCVELLAMFESKLYFKVHLCLQTAIYVITNILLKVNSYLRNYAAFVPLLITLQFSIR